MLTPDFWARVDKASHPGGCWLWTGYRTRQGYGRHDTSGTKILAHRLAWALTHGDPGALCVLHRCDNPPCVNPSHLFLGTNADNNADKIAKGRGARDHGKTFRGSRHGATHLTEADVLAIRAACDAGTRQKELAERYRLSPMGISQIVRGVTWKHVGGPIQRSRIEARP